MAARSAKRIMAELRDLVSIRDELIRDHGIHFYTDDTNIQEVWFYIEGRENTPYFGGSYLFQATYPETNYPNEPFKLSFWTRKAEWRCHPNFYTSGKVCLSSINTFGSEDWSPCRTLRGEIINIAARLDEHPIRYEPSFETTNNPRYNKYVAHGNFLYGIVGMIQGGLSATATASVIPMRTAFRPIMIERFKTLMAQGKLKEAALKWAASPNQGAIIYNGTGPSAPVQTAEHFNQCIQKMEELYSSLTSLQSQ